MFQEPGVEVTAAQNTESNFELTESFLPNDSETVQGLIAQLGAPEFSKREEADFKLKTIGGPALAQLKKATRLSNHTKPDLEIQLRAKRLVQLIGRQQYSQKIDSFLALDASDPPLVGWQAFRKITDDTVAARRLFVTMHEVQGDLIEKTLTDRSKSNPINQSGQRLSSVIRKDLYVSNLNNANKVVGTIAAILFLKSIHKGLKNEQDVAKADESEFKRIQQALIKPVTLTFIEKTGTRHSIRRLVSKWLKDRPEGQLWETLFQLELAKEFQLKEFAPTAFEVLNKKYPTHARVLAIETTLRLAVPDSIAQLRPFYDDQTVLGIYTTGSANPLSGPGKVEIRFCDLALASSIVLAGLDPIDYGFDRESLPNDSISPTRTGFGSEELRRSAFEKWSKQKNTPNRTGLK
ncbi:MAG: hypothetical protein AAF939_11660 [Planctomycetota bacterium]